MLTSTDLSLAHRHDQADCTCNCEDAIDAARTAFEIASKALDAAAWAIEELADSGDEAGSEEACELRRLLKLTCQDYV